MHAKLPQHNVKKCERPLTRPSWWLCTVQACGYVSDVDPRHKLNTFILKNPPENKMSKEEKK